MAQEVVLRGLTEKQAEYVASLHDKLDRAKSALTEKADAALTMAVTAGTAFGVGYFEGRYPERNVLGMDASLAAGLGAGGVAVFSKQGTMQERVALAAANGGISAYAFKMGREAGEKARVAAAQKK